MRKTLVILAAGIGSRFGGGIKQLTAVDKQRHIIIDYSIHDAIAAGFGKIIFVIRRAIEEDFKAVIGDRISAVCETLNVEVAYAYQEITHIPGEVPQGRTKPWGTGHAVLACDGLIDASFAVINADDYYGKNGFKKAAEFMASHPEGYGLIGYQLKNTLSDNGGVTRGLCTADRGRLLSIAETRNIVKTPDGAEADGKKLDLDSVVSMNFWCYPPAFLDELRTGFPAFLASMPNPAKDEYLLPVIAGQMLKKGGEFTVLTTDDQWFGVTYQEDKQSVIDSFAKLHADGVYQDDLYSDLNRL